MKHITEKLMTKGEGVIYRIHFSITSEISSERISETKHFYRNLIGHILFNNDVVIEETLDNRHNYKIYDEYIYFGVQAMNRKRLIHQILYP